MGVRIGGEAGSFWGFKISRLQVMTFDGWVDHLMREMLTAFTDDWFRVRPLPRVKATRHVSAGWMALGFGAQAIGWMEKWGMSLILLLLSCLPNERVFLVPAARS